MTQNEALILKKLYGLRHTQDFVEMQVLQTLGLSHQQIVDAVGILAGQGLVEWIPHAQNRSPAGKIDFFVAKITDEGVRLMGQQ
jgi:hypothetical protein